MRRLSIAATVVALGLGVAATAFAADENRARIDVPREQWLPIANVVEQFATMGYQVQGIESDDNLYEVEAIDPNGLWVKAYVHPVSGEILKERSDRD